MPDGEDLPALRPCSDQTLFPKRSDGKASPVRTNRTERNGIRVMTSPLETREQAKARAKALRAELARGGIEISHSAALERVAVAEGHASWNALSARLANEPEVPLQLGDRVAGSYLKQGFAGTVIGVHQVANGGAYDITIEFDEPVDVVTFESFSAYRRRVNARISAGGVSFSKTSDGVPHMVVSRDTI